MPKEIRVHPVYRAINKPFTIWGAERRPFFLALIMGGATFNFFGSLLSGIAMFVGLFLAARWATQTDLQMLRILLNSTKCKTQYEPPSSCAWPPWSSTAVWDGVLGTEEKQTVPLAPRFVAHERQRAGADG